MIAEPNRTDYDLSFTVLGTPVRVHPMFWLVALLIGPNPLGGEGAGLAAAVWVAAVFVSILVHEMGHALMFRRYGSWGRVWLYWFGGVAIADDARLWGWRQVAVSLAGPAAGFLLAALVYGSVFVVEWRVTPYAVMMYFSLLMINIYWGLINLLPVFPLDGGQALRGLLEALRVEEPLEKTLKVSTVTGGAVAVWCLMNLAGEPRALLELAPWWLRFGSIFTVLMFGALAYGSYQMLRPTRYDDPWR